MMLNGERGYLLERGRRDHREQLEQMGYLGHKDYKGRLELKATWE
jgi:hypothetical protein